MHLLVRRLCTSVVLFTAASISIPSSSDAQVRVGKDSATRLTRFGRDVVYVTATGFGFSAWDQLMNDPEEWGKGWRGYRHRVISNVGKSVIQESVTQGLAAAMNRPLDYPKCRCPDFNARASHAVLAAVRDQMPNGTHKLAVPRIVGAYTGAFAQATWRPGGHRGRSTLLNGSATLGVGALINLWYEFKP